MKEQALLDWFENSARPFLSRHAKERLASLDDDRERMKKLLAAPDKVTVCFLGNSGIGKSTLLNALAAGENQVLPAGGIGPLTAQATEVHFSEAPSFKVVYHPKKHLWKVAFALEQRVVSQLRAEKKAKGAASGDLESPSQSELDKELDDEDRTEALAAANHSDSDPDAPNTDPMDALIVSGQ